MIGTEDRLLNKWAQFVKKFNFFPLFGDGSTRYVLTHQLPSQMQKVFFV